VESRADALMELSDRGSQSLQVLIGLSSPHPTSAREQHMNREAGTGRRHFLEQPQQA